MHNGSDQQGGVVFDLLLKYFFCPFLHHNFLYIGLYLKLLYKVFFRETFWSCATVSQQ